MKNAGPVLLLVLMIGCVAALSQTDYGFYNPQRGVVSEGRDDHSTDKHAREVMTLTVTDEELRRFKGKATLESLSAFYGTQDSLRCSVEKTFETTDMVVAKRPLPLGGVARLCLN